MIKTQILKMTMTLQKRWKCRRKLQKKNSWILVVIAVCFFPLTSITTKATVTVTSATCRGGSKNLATRMFAVSSKELHKEFQPTCDKILDPPLVCELFTLLQYQIMCMTSTNNGYEHHTHQ